MKPILSPIELNESSFNIIRLHQALSILGFAVSEHEKNEHFAGKTTFEQTRALQRSLRITFQEDLLVDNATAVAINRELQSKGLFKDESGSFRVRGTVKFSNGEVAKKHRLMAVDVDLKGAAVYRTITKLNDIRTNGGFEILEELSSDARGNYETIFNSAQFKKAERKKADVVVFAIDDQDIVGRSRMTNTEHYSKTGEVLHLDVFIAKATSRQTEYASVMGALEPFLKESEVTILQLGSSPDQVEFTARELDLTASVINIVVNAARLNEGRRENLSHELLYGIGRQSIPLRWQSFHKRKADELKRAIQQSIDNNFIQAFNAETISTFLKQLVDGAFAFLLDHKVKESALALDSILSPVLPQREQRVAYLDAMRTHTSDAATFWSSYLPAQPAFKDRPELIAGLQTLQQLTLITVNHQPLVNELLLNRKISSAKQLVELNDADWQDMLARTGVPEAIKGATIEERRHKYTQLIKQVVHAAFPTQKISRMVRQQEFSFEDAAVGQAIGTFLQNTPEFDFRSSRIHTFESQIRNTAPSNYLPVTKELKRMQRLFQVSPTPEVMQSLIQNGFYSAHDIASYPQKSFVKLYADALGGTALAESVHQRASFNGARTEYMAMKTQEMTHMATPGFVLSPSQQQETIVAIENHLPNYSELFGSPDICECDHCRSVYSAAAYFVDLLRFLWRGDKNEDQKSPLDLLAERRPDLLHLCLTCENTNTIIPYIDLANEVMEYYTVHDQLDENAAFDTGEATADELRASPQNVNIEAYKMLNDAVYPFTLPYHQPLDVIRTYSDHLHCSRKDVMQSFQIDFSQPAQRAIAAESLRISPAEFRILTLTTFDGQPDTTDLHSYYGYTNANGLQTLTGVQEFLKRTGIQYTDLVELVKTKFINPHQARLDFLQQLFSGIELTPSQIYNKLEQIEAGTFVLQPNDPLNEVLESANITMGEFTTWVQQHLNQFRLVITLYQEDSLCDLDTTALRTVGSVYSGNSNNDYQNIPWSKIHRFIRLWRKLGWSIHDVDLLLTALDAGDINADTIEKISSVLSIQAQLKKPLNELAVFWGAIDTYGNKAAYKKLFLNKAVQRIDPIFEADTWGNYLTNATADIAGHMPAILAAFRMSEEDLQAILEVATVTDNGNPRLLTTADNLNLANLSTIYRYVLMAKALQLKVKDLCLLIRLFQSAPFSNYNIQQGKFESINPTSTLKLVELASALKESKFKTSILQYIFEGVLPVESSAGLDQEKIQQAVRTIRDAFTAIMQLHTDKPVQPLTSEIVQGKLANTYPADIIQKLFGILDGTGSFETITTTNLAIDITLPLSAKFTYVRGSGRLISAGVMTDAERQALKALPNVTPTFETAVDGIYQMPELFIREHFTSLFANINDALLVLLGDPSMLAQKLELLYNSYIPFLQKKLRQDAIVQHIAALTGLEPATAAILAAADITPLVDKLATEGFDAVYYSDPNFNTVVLNRYDTAINFGWNAAPDPVVPADNFSVRWSAFLAAPVSGEHTLIVETAQADDAFRLYLDGVIILEKPAGDPLLSWEIVASLNSDKLHQLSLEYIEQSQAAGISLFWKTTTSVRQLITSGFLYPSQVVADFGSLVTLYHRASQFITGFKLSEREVNHFSIYGANFGNIDFKALTPVHWQRVYDYVFVRNRVPQSLNTLIDVFEKANKSAPGPTTDELNALVYGATAWDSASLIYLVNTYFSISINDLKNEKALLRLYQAINIIQRSGISVAALATWATAETDFDNLNNTAQSVKSTVKAKYEEADWLEIGGGLSDKIRENQKQALVSHLLTKPALIAWGAIDADSLFEYFLIDVQMGACMDTSRIVQANSSVQMFVNRCLLNLESDKAANGNEHGVSPAAIDPDRWEWMKNYRVWEANRKIFLYPENWLEPEWRDDRTPFFKELESELTQDDINERSVESAFRNYLTKLNSVANLEVVGSVQEYGTDNQPLLYHVVGRTNTIPYIYYYRSWNNTYRKWTAWEKIGADIRGVDEPDQDNNKNGVHIIPVIWKNRLYIFWPEWIKHVDPPSTDGMTGFDTMSENVSSFKGREYWEVKLSWTEYADGKWSPKAFTKESVYTDEKYPKTFSYSSEVVQSTQQLKITAWSTVDFAHRHYFTFDDIQSPVTISYPSNLIMISGVNLYMSDFMKLRKKAKLVFLDNEYLKAQWNHTLQYSNNVKDFQGTVKDPFFYTARRRTYFVRPINVRVIEAVEHPELQNPFIPGEIVDDSGWTNPIDIPHFGPDDRRDWIINYQDGFAEITGNPQWNEQTALDAEGLVGSTNAVLRSRGMNGNGSPVARALSLELDTETAFANSHQMIPQAFGGYQSTDSFVEVGIIPGLAAFNMEKGLEFHTFYHPYSTNFVKRLNQGGVAGLMKSDTVIAGDNGSKFTNSYQPNTTYVPKGADFAKRTYYKENVCFDVYGANSVYNWELFFHAPLYIATRLSKNGRYQEAMKWYHYIFNPTTDALPAPGETEISRYWQVPPFKTEPVKDLQEWFMDLLPNNNPNKENLQIGEWRDDPFKPHLVARNRPIAYMKNVVIKYIENLTAWADSLFRIDTMETVNEALQLYVMANHILGPRPQFVPRRGEIKAETYNSLKTKWDSFSNALVELENIFPYSSDIPTSSNNQGNLLGGGPALYFCIPSNEKLLETWDLVADRLFKIRHCMNIDGVERKLALFAPPIDPAVLINAVAQGLSLGSILADLSSPPPIHRFNFLLQQTKELCAEVKSLGSALLSAMEKKDAEELNLKRSTHELAILEIMTGIKERQILEGKAHRENLLKTRASAMFRVNHYGALLNKEPITIPDIPVIEAELTKDSQLPPDTNLQEQHPNVDQELEPSGESGVSILKREKEEITRLSDANYMQNVASVIQLGSNAILALIPQIAADGKPFGVGAGVEWGGSNLSYAANAVAQAFQIDASIETFEAGNAIRFANYVRREQDWTLQLNLAMKEIIQLDKQITAADIRIQIAEKELKLHAEQIKNTLETELFLKEKDTNYNLYQWTKEQLFAVFKQSYNMAYDLARKTEKAYRYETGNELTNFIQYGYWDGSRDGLLAGEKLALALHQMGKSYTEENRRELEMTKHVSMAQLDPLAVQQLRTTGQCSFAVPEECFDLDYPGHYFRRIKTVSISIPCIAGPHTTVSATLRLMNNHLRTNTSMNSEDNYEHNHDQGIWIDDDRFRSSNVPVKSIATSSAQQDDGLFELNFRDERYLPFEGAGAVSNWKLELMTDPALRQFDYSTISDVVIHINYTARENGGLFKEKTLNYLNRFFTNAMDSTKQPLMRMFSLKHDFPTAWHKFLYPATPGAEQVLQLSISREQFPYFTKERGIKLMAINVLVRSRKNGDYHMVLTATDSTDDLMTSPQVSMAQQQKYGNMQVGTLAGVSSGFDIEEVNILSPITLKLKHSSSANYTLLETSPDEVLDMMMVLHYKLVQQ